MEDETIVALYWARDEAAIPATAKKYGTYCAASPGISWKAPRTPRSALATPISTPGTPCRPAARRC